MSKPHPESQPAEEPIERQELRALMNRLAQDEPGVMPELLSWFQNHPDLWSLVSDLARQAEVAVLTLYAGSDVTNQQVMSGRLRKLKADLAGPSPSPLEQMLVDRVALDWLLLHLADHTALPTGPSKQPIPLSEKFREKTREQLHRRLTRSAKTLAEVRRLERRRGVPAGIGRLTAGGATVDPLKGTWGPRSASAAE